MKCTCEKNRFTHVNIGLHGEILGLYRYGQLLHLAESSCKTCFELYMSLLRVHML